MTAIETSINSLLAFYEGAGLPEEATAITEKRSAALALLSEKSFPTTRDEYWKYTRTAPLLKTTYVNEYSSDVDVKPSDIEATQLFLINGILDDERTILKEDNIEIGSLAEAKKQFPVLVSEYFGKLSPDTDNQFCALNSAYHEDGVFVRVKKNTQAQFPVVIHHVLNGENPFSQPRFLFIAEEGAEVKVIFNHTADKGFTNAVTEAFVANNAQMKLVSFQESAGNLMENIYAHQGRDSYFKSSVFSFDGKLVRNNLNIAVAGENCETDLFGLTLLENEEHVDHHTLIDHQAPNCQSNELYRNVLSGKSTGVFNGRVYVHPEAQQINAFQQNNNVLLSGNATVNAKPELEIYADDVKCSHGSTTGELDEEALFYLRSRGMNKATAERVLVRAFAGEIIDKVDHEAVKTYLEKRIEESELN